MNIHVNERLDVHSTHYANNSLVTTVERCHLHPAPVLMLLAQQLHNDSQQCVRHNGSVDA